MRTDELIVQLARSAKPIRPLPPPGVRALRWFIAAAVVVLAGIAAIGPRDDLGSALGQPVFLGSLVALVLTLASGAAGAFILSVPGAERSAVQRALPLLAAAGWSAIWLMTVAAVSETAGQTTAAIHAACVIEIVLGAVVTGGLLLMMIARAAPLRPVWAAALASLASMATGAVLAQILCPLDDAWHQLIGHVLIGVIVAGVGLLAGRRVLA